MRMFLLVFVSCTVAFGCESAPQTIHDGSPQASSSNSELEGSWALKRMGESKALPGVTLTVADTRLSGHGGCNSYGGTFSMSGDVLSMSPMERTELACADDDQMAQESAFFEALAVVNASSVEGAILTLDGPGGELVFERRQNVSIIKP